MDSPDLPSRPGGTTPGTTPGTPYRITLVCLGNICRSAMADVVLTDRLERAGLADAVEVRSAGTGDWHVGNPMDERAAAQLTSAGYDASRHRARQFEADWLEDSDLVLAMDASNRSDVATLGSTDPSRLRMFRDFDPLGGGDVPDPYYGGDDGFADVLATVERTSDALVEVLRGAGTGARAESGAETGADTGVGG